MLVRGKIQPTRTISTSCLPVQLDVHPQVDRFVFPDVHRTVFAQEHAVYIRIKVEGPLKGGHYRY